MTLACVRAACSWSSSSTLERVNSGLAPWPMAVAASVAAAMDCTSRRPKKAAIIMAQAMAINKPSVAIATAWPAVASMLLTGAATPIVQPEMAECVKAS